MATKLEEEITKYLEEEGQPELFDIDAMLNKRIDIPEDLKERVREMGRSAADAAVEFIFRRINRLLQEELRKMNYTPDPAYFEGDMYNDVSEYIQETDSFMMLTSDLCGEYITGMEEAWPHLIRG